MNAGQALGLLAGLGAMNAIRGGREGTGKRFTGLMDMIDGGGAGASGDRFEGGGLLSMLGNLFMKPIEAQDNVERISRDTSATNALTKTLEDMAKGGALTSRLDGKDGLPMPMTRRTPITEYSDSLLPPTLPVTPDPRNFQRGTEPSTLTENQRMRAAGILAGQAAMQPITQKQLQSGAAIEAPAALGIATMGSYKTPEPPKTPDPMGLLPRQTMIPPAATNMDVPSVSALFDVPSAPPSEAQTMLQSLSETIPPRAMENDPAIVQGYKDYVISGGRDDYSTYYKSRPEYQAERQLFAETGGTLFDLPDSERKRLINERADIIRRETPKPMPFTGPAF